MNRRLAENIFSLLVLQGANYILPLLTLPYLVRVLGPEKFGIIAFAQAFIQYFVILTDYGFNLSATRQIAQFKEDSAKISRLFCAVLGVKFLLMSLSFVLLTTIVMLVPSMREQWPVYLATSLMVLGTALFPQWFFQGMERMKYITALNITAKVIATCSIFIFVRSEADYVIAAGIQAAGMTIAGLIGLLAVRRITRITLKTPNLTELKRVLADGWHVFLSTAAVNLYTSSNTVILGLLTNPVAVGYFSAAEKLVKAVTGLISPLGQALYPHIATLVINSRSTALAFIRKALILFTSIGLLLSILLYTFAMPLVKLLLGEQYLSAVSVVQLMAFLPLIIAVSNILGIQTMLNFGFQKEFSTCLVLGAAVNLTLIFPLSYLFGIEGAAISVLLTETVITLSMGWMLRKQGVYLFAKKEIIA